MKETAPNGRGGAQEPLREELVTELLVMPDGQILVHNLTPVFARLLEKFNPDEKQIAARAARSGGRPGVPAGRDPASHPGEPNAHELSH